MGWTLYISVWRNKGKTPSTTGEMGDDVVGWHIRSVYKQGIMTKKLIYQFVYYDGCSIAQYIPMECPKNICEDRLICNLSINNFSKAIFII